MRILDLPEELRVAIPAATTGDPNKAQAPAVVKSSNKLQDFLALTPSAKEKRAKSMPLADPRAVFSAIDAFGDVSVYPLEHLGR